MTSARYAELFLSESREHLSVVNGALLDLERGRAPADAVRSLFRAVHSMKGMAGAMGYSAVAELAHELESLLDGLRGGQRSVDGDVIDALFVAADALDDAVTAAIDGADGRVDCSAVIERLRAICGAPATPRTVPAGAVAGATHGSPADDAGDDAWLVEIRQAPDTPLRGVRATIVIQRLEGVGRVLAVTPSLAELQAGAYDGSFTVRLRPLAGVDAARVADAARSAGDVAGVAVRTAVGRAAAADERTATATPPPTTATVEAVGGDSGADTPAAGPRGTAAEPAAAATRSVRVDVRHLDSLLDVVGELIIARGRLRESLGATPGSDVRDAFGHLSRLIAELQTEVLTSRLVPVWQVFDRFPRLVRDAARTLGKEVDFVMEGKEIELDRSLLDEIGDPVVHLLRNAMDHGIELPAERVAAGKPPRGRLTLSALRDRDAVLLRVADDGRGIDRSRVVRRARELGLVGDGDQPGDEELMRLVARAGFSTAERVTDISGRGVGVDAVQERLRALGGSVEMRTTAGAGMTVTLRLPLTLAIVRTLLARVGGEIYALPASHVAATSELAAARQVTVRGEPALVLGRDVVPALDLRELVGLPAGGGDDRELVVVESNDRRLGLVVDELLGEQEAVVKRFDLVRGALPCFSGATVLGNGMPALIVDVGRLLT
ncbi:MAG: Hpt domain-containing protein [Gemmatimonadaceae bacterium]